MTLTVGPNLGQLDNGAPGEGHYTELMRQWRAFDGLVMPRVLSRVAALPSSGMVDGDTHLLTATANINKIARYSTRIASPDWEFYTPKDGWFVWSVGDQKTYRFKGDPLAWVEDSTSGGGGDGGSVEQINSSSGILDLSAAEASTIMVTLFEDITSITYPSGVSDVRKDLIIRFRQDSTAGWTVDLSGISWDGDGIEPSIGLGVAEVTYVTAVNVSNSGWEGFK